DGCAAERADVIGIGEDASIIIEPDERRPKAKGILALKRGFQRLNGRPDEENQRDNQLGGQQKVRQQLVWKYGAFALHGSSHGRRVTDRARRRCPSFELKKGPDWLWPPITKLLVGRFKLAQDLVAAGNCGIQRFLCGLLTCEHGLELLVDQRTNLAQIAKANALGVGRDRKST